MSVGRDRLDELVCEGDHADDEPCDGSLFLHSRCHPDTATWGVYAHGVLTIQCAECEKPIVSVAVADKST